MPRCGRCGGPVTEGARFCSLCGGALDVSPATARARKVVTLLFADVQGFTELGERLDPESLHQVIGRWFRRADGAIERHGGAVEKHIGDAVMGAFGVPVAHEDDALRAARSALEMRDALADLNAELGRRWGVELSVRTGLNTGEVVVADDPGGQWSLVGDAINVAQRLESAADPGQILVGEQTARLLAGRASVAGLEPITVKGKRAPVAASRLIAVSAEPPTSPAAKATPLVGRAHELELLSRAFEATAAGRTPRLVAVVGPAGIGKSRLARALIDATAQRATSVVGRCLPYGEAITYWPVAEIARQLAGAPQEEALVAVLEHGGVSRSEAGSIAASVARAAGFTAGDVPVEEAHWAVRKLLEAAARRRPLIVTLEDVHWASPTLLELIEHVARFAADAPLLLVCLSRPELLEERPGWRTVAGDRASVVRLAPLAESSAAELLAVLCAGSRLAEPEAARLLAAAEGNPFFLQQMVAMHAEAGAPIALPPTIQAVLTARIDGLPPAERRILEHASVEGRTFHRAALAALLAPAHRAQLDAGLRALVRRELIRPGTPDLEGQQAFRFGHILIRDATYALVPKQRRAELHERLAGWLERTVGRDSAELPEMAGHHLERAFGYRVDVEPAARRAHAELARRGGRHLGVAGRAALARDDLPAANGLLDRAALLLPEGDPERGVLLPDLGVALTELGRLDEAEALLDSAASEAAARGDELAEAHAVVARLSARLQVDTEASAHEVRERFDALRATLERRDDDLGLDRLWRLRALVHWIAARSQEADSAWERAARHALAAGDDRGRASSLSWLASSAYFGPLPAHEGIGRCESILDQLGPLSRARAVALDSLAGLRAMRGELQAARRLLADSNAILAELGRTMQSAVSHPAAFVELSSGNLAGAEAMLRAGYERLSEMGERALLSSTAAMLAQALYEQGRLDEAWALTEVAEQTAASDDLSAQITWRAERGRLLARRGEPDRAKLIAAEAVRIAGRTDWLTEHADALRAQAAVLTEVGEPRAAAAALRRAVVLYERKGNTIGARRARSMRAVDVPA